MYDLFLKILREELNTTGVVDIQRIKINEYRNYLSNIIHQISTQNAEVSKYFNEIIKNILRDVDLLTRIRLVKNILSSTKPSDSVDNDFYNIVDKLIYFMKIYLSSLHVGYDNYIYVLFKNKCIVNNRVFNKGDVVKLDPSTCLKLYLSDCVELLIKPCVKYLIDKK